MKSLKEEHERLSRALYKKFFLYDAESCFIFLVSLLISLLFYLACLYFNSYSVDWKTYSGFEPNFNSIYYAREVVGWWLINTLSFDDSSTSNAFVSSVIYFLLIHSSFSLLKQIKIRMDCRDNLSVYLCMLPFFVSNFYLLLSLNIMRQGLSVAFLMYSLTYLVAGNNKRMMLCFIVSVLCHNSSLFYTPVILFHLSFLRYFRPFVAWGALATIFLGSVIIELANKSSGATSQNNSVYFALVMIFLFLFYTLISWRSNKKVNTLFFKRSDNFTYILIYFVFSIFAFFSDENSFERLVYSSMPVAMVLFCSVILRLKGFPYYVLLALASTPILIIIFSRFPAIKDQFIGL